MHANRTQSAQGARSQRLAFETEIESVPRPVVARGQDYETGICTQMHVHSRSQLVYAVTGTMVVTAGAGVWAVPPQRAVWIPAGVEHSVQSNNRLNMRSIFVDPQYGTPFSDCCMVSITPLLRELILCAVKLPTLYAMDGPEDRLINVLLDQLKAAPLAPLYLTMPVDRRLRKIAESLLEHPADKRSARAWGKEVGVSTRTLTRLFPAETGMSFRLWQQNARIMEAIRRLTVGETVTNVALEVGYESPSAFVFMFRRIMGQTPGKYLESLLH